MHDESIKFDLKIGPEPWLRMFQQNFPLVGTVDLFCGEIRNHEVQISALAGLSLALAYVPNPEHNELPAFHHILVLLPSHATISCPLEQLSDDIFEKIVSFQLSEHPETDTERFSNSIRSRIKIIGIKSFDAAQLAERIKKITAPTAIVISNADIYISTVVEAQRKADAMAYDLSGEIRLNLPEDIWVPNLHYLLNRITEIGKEIPVYAFALVFKGKPLRQRNWDLLNSIINLAIYSADTTSGDAELVKNFDNWVKLAVDDELDELASEIDSHGFSPENAALIKMQCLFAANKYGTAYSTILPYIEDLRGSNDPDILVKIALVAVEAGDFMVARDVLYQVEDLLIYEPQFVLVIRVARKLEDDDLLGRVTERLVKIFPTSLLAISERFKSCRTIKDYRNLLAIIDNLEKPIQEEPIRYYRILCKHLGEEEGADFGQAIKEVLNEVPNYQYDCTLACATHYFRNFEYLRSSELILDTDWPADYLHDASQLAIAIVKKLFIAKDVEDPDIHSSEVNAATPNNTTITSNLIAFVCNYVKSHPSDGSTRTLLSRVLSFDIAGMLGLAQLLFVLSKCKSPQSLEEKPDAASASELSEADFMKCLQVYMSQLQPAHILGIGTLPEIGAECSLDMVFDSIVKLIRYASSYKLVTEEDKNFIFQLLHIAILMSNKIGRSNMDIRLIAVVGGGLCLSGMYQAARDLTEHCLLLASDGASGLRQRIAWNAFVDIYLRSHNPLEALLGLLCAQLCANEPIPPLDYYNELSHQIRLFRELRAYKLALIATEKAKEIAKLLPTEEELIHRIKFQELSIKALMIAEKSQNSATDEVLSEISQEAVSLHKAARENKEDILPTASLLAQLCHFYKDKSDTRFQAIMAEIEATAFTSESHALILALLSEASPSVEAIQELVGKICDSRYAEDLANDVRLVKVLAHRALAHTKESDDVGKIAYLLECLSDHSIKTVKDESYVVKDSSQLIEEAKRKLARTAINKLDMDDLQISLQFLGQEVEYIPASKDQYIHYPADLCDYIAFLSDIPLEVYLLGLDINHKLVSLSFLNKEGKITLENRETFDSDSFLMWKKRYPYEYASVNPSDPYKGIEYIERTLRGIGVSPHCTPIESNYDIPRLIVTETDLQAIPPNLFLMEGRLVGEKVPVAGTPSIAWLRSSRQNIRKSSGHSQAWISAPTTSDEWNTLAFLRDETDPIVKKYNIPLSTDALPPSELRNSDIAIIGAHGSLHEGHSWFRAVADEDTTRLSTRDLALALAGSGVVILFVCSGGRVDTNPYASSTVGLSRLLLGEGCRAIVASPWPMSATIVVYWLPAFLESYLGGATVVKATHSANVAVATNYNFHPMYSLAMNVFGDPLVTIRENEESALDKGHGK